MKTVFSKSTLTATLALAITLAAFLPSAAFAQTGILKPPSVRDIDMGTDSYRSKQEIIAVANHHFPDLTNIYNKHLKLKPDFSGKVALKFTIAPSGEIISISIASSATGYPEFDNAVKDAVADWKWKAIKSGNATITIPLNFINQQEKKQ